ADRANGLLSIELQREIPEALKPRKIEIGSGNLLEGE
ncbi:MAG: heat-shock protein, partial [Pseudoalteromonas sp.]